jgi:phosphatidylglycerol:prolipoprotein diacylglycerol transferase
MLQKGGLSWYGGLISAGVIGPLYLKIKKIPVYKILDLIAPFLALGQAIGRIGCLLNGCCFGKETPYGIYFPVHDKIIFPSQMVSVILMLIIFMILRVLQDKPHAQGRIFFLYLFLYSLKRFFVEFIRSDNPAVIFNLTLFQIISFIIFCFAGYKLFALRKKLIT